MRKVKNNCNGKVKNNFNFNCNCNCNIKINTEKLNGVSFFRGLLRKLL